MGVQVMGLYSLLIGLFVMGSGKRLELGKGGSLSPAAANASILQPAASKSPKSPSEDELVATEDECFVDLSCSSCPETDWGGIPPIIPMLFQTIKHVGEGANGTVNRMKLQSKIPSGLPSTSIEEFNAWQQDKLPDWLRRARQVYVKSALFAGEGYVELYINLLLRKLNNAHVAKFLGYGVADGRLVLFFEDEAMVTENGDSNLGAFVGSVASRKLLATKLGVKPEIPEDNGEAQRAWAEAVIQAISDQAHKGLDELHKSGIIHGDIKSNNLIITNGGVIKFIDFGHSGDDDNERRLSTEGRPEMRLPPKIFNSSAGQLESSGSVDDDVQLLQETLNEMHLYLGCRMQDVSAGGAALTDYVKDDVDKMARRLYPKLRKRMMSQFDDLADGVNDSENESSVYEWVSDSNGSNGSDSEYGSDSESDWSDWVGP